MACTTEMICVYVTVITTAESLLKYLRSLKLLVHAVLMRQIKYHSFSINKLSSQPLNLSERASSFARAFCFHHLTNLKGNGIFSVKTNQYITNTSQHHRNLTSVWNLNPRTAPASKRCEPRMFVKGHCNREHHLLRLGHLSTTVSCANITSGLQDLDLLIFIALKPYGRIKYLIVRFLSFVL